MIQNPSASIGNIQRFGEQGHGVQDLDPFAAHDIGKDGVVLDRLLDPEHIVEQQFLAIVRGQAPMGEAGWRDDNLPQLAGFGMYAKGMICH